ncbi:phasin family protein [soil metagenome]
MYAIPEQLSEASKASLDAQLSMFTDLSQQVVHGLEQVFHLNLNVARSSMANSAAAAQQILSARTPQEMFSLVTANAQPAAEGAVVYGRDFAGIVSSTQAAFAKAAESHIDDTSRKLLELIDDVSKNAPAGSEQAIAFVKSAIDTANASYGRLNKSARQAVENVEGNAESVVRHFSKAAQKSSSRNRK